MESERSVCLKLSKYKCIIILLSAMYVQQPYLVIHKDTAKRKRKLVIVKTVPLLRMKLSLLSLQKKFRKLCFQ